VGERRESAAAMRLLSSLPAWREKVVVSALAERARGLVTDADVEALLTPVGTPDFAGGELARAVERQLAEGP
jgi:hypothetical protein